MKIALAQLNPMVGDIAGNTRRILDALAEAEQAGADMLVCPELSIVGYPPRDLLLKPRFIADNQAALEQIARRTNRVLALVGFVHPNPARRGRPLHNAIALCGQGRVLHTSYKSLLPTYDIFDEQRYFEPSDQVGVMDVTTAAGDLRLGVTICEDLWVEPGVLGHRGYHQDPLSQQVKAGAQVAINVSASPFWAGKYARRLEVLRQHVARHKVPIVFCNQVGGNDELIFDGASLVVAGDGSIIAQAKAFEEDLLIVDLDDPAGNRREPYPEDLDSVHAALILGLRDYVGKCGFREAVIGLSGGIDSSLVAALAAEALGPEHVLGVLLPSRYSSDHSLADARKLAENLGIGNRVVTIEALHHGIEKLLAEHFTPRTMGDLTAQNIQARLRGLLLMAFSNQQGRLLLTTGNKSELAVGYCTLYGDMCGGLAVISDVPKTMVYALSRRINERAGREIIPANCLTKVPSAELRPDQTDQDTLPAYEVLDDILAAYVEREESVDQIIAAGFDAETVRRVCQMVDRAEFKRRQAAPGLKVSLRAFGTGRRMPIAARF